MNIKRGAYRIWWAISAPWAVLAVLFMFTDFQDDEMGAWFALTLFVAAGPPLLLLRAGHMVSWVVRGFQSMQQT